MKRKSLSLGKTINIQNFESIRVDMTWELENGDHENFEALYEKAKGDLKAVINDIVRAIK